ncbi:MAG: PepSY-associated TM helix domain-containing protein [Desulfofustis sp. PB-SRB1]|jgi:hypothetical protein|nr:PepSY-associated TM helix domain-containing protein [Desulfofustis sp. PB-SRB1]MBM1003755.1 PepSY-associated TM helix domain-containing protein [Desulfofustis sp. PB-SRB1]HBH31271.1 hypothetical protein [Desulfofustis sp.]
MKWRKFNIIIHRDLGYLCFGLTIIYAISGVAVNHIQDWNPTYVLEKIVSSVNLAGIESADNEALTSSVLEQLGETSELKNVYRQDADTLKIFVVNNNITVDLNTGSVFQEKSTKRPFLYEANFLHLNHPKKLWTWFADLYAVSLGLLAVSGLFILKGKKGLAGRGKWLVGVGFVIPLFFLWLYS